MTVTTNNQYFHKHHQLTGFSNGKWLFYMTGELKFHM